MNVKLNDNVVVMSGKYAGKKGKVIATSPKAGRVTVEGINIQKKAQKARKSNEVSKIVEKEGAIDVSNVMVICPACDKAIRVKHELVDGKKHRVCPKCNAVLDTAYTGKAAKAAKKEEAPKKRVRKRAKKEEATAETAAPETAEGAEKE